jgi:hypothetical protein
MRNFGSSLVLNVAVQEIRQQGVCGFVQQRMFLVLCRFLVSCCLL